MAGRDLPPLSALRAFEAAARHLSFRVAAEELGLTQSAISHQVAALEQHFGARLFDRAGRRIALSEPGRLLFPLVCCVLPAVMVALGAGAALAGLVTAVPQLIWLSEHKGLVFGSAFAMLALSGALLWRARRLPCPADPVLASACVRLRRASLFVWAAALAFTVLGAAFAFVLPAFY